MQPQGEILVPEILVPLGGAFLSILMLWGWMWSLKHRRLLEDLPTSKVKGVFIGLVELKGTAEVESPLFSRLAQHACVAYDWGIDEHWERTVTETYTDSDGNTKTRTKTESGWIRVDGGVVLEPFYLRDDTGIILVHPEGATFEMTSVFDKTVGIADPLYYGMGPARVVPDSTHRRRFHEQAFPLHAPLFIVGQARERKDLVAPEIAADKNAPMFLISNRTEEQVLRSRGWSLWLWAGFGMLFMVLGWIIKDLGIHQIPAKEAWIGWFLPVGIFVGLLVFAWMWQVFNSLVDLRNRTNRAWSLVEIELKRRADLIPQIIRTVQAIQGYEKEVQTALVALRNQANTSSGVGVEGLTHPLKALAEAYPDLKTGGNFSKLMVELSNTEERIALARGFYNDQATWNNTRLERIPEGWLARLMGFRNRSLWSATDMERAPVRVHLQDQVDLQEKGGSPPPITKLA